MNRGASVASDHHLIDLVGRIYDAALDPTLWPTALEEMMKAAGGVGGSLLERHANSFNPRKITTPGLADYYAEYDRSEYWRIEARVRRLRALKDVPGSAYQHIASGRIITDLDFISPEEAAEDPFYQDVLRPYELGYGAYLWIRLPGKVLVLSTSRSNNAGPFSRRDLDRMELLRGHVQRALSASAQLLSAKQVSRSIFDWLATLDLAAVMLAADGQLLFANRAAEGLEGISISLHHNRLRGLTPADSAALRRLTSSALGPEGILSDPSPARINRRDNGRPLIVQALPLSRASTGNDMLSSPAGALVIFTDPKARSRNDPLKSLRLLGLTPAEARIANLAGQGWGAVDIADQVGNTVGTVRYMLKRIYSKLSVARQSELAIVVARLSSVSPAHDDSRN